MKKNKKILVISIIIVIWSGLMLYFYNEKIKLENKQKPQVIILNNNFFWKYQQGNWSKISLNDEENIFNWKKFDIYIDNEYYNTYKYVFSNGKGYYYDENNESQKILGNKTMINKGSYLSIIDYRIDDINDKDNQILYDFAKKNLLSYDEITDKKKYVIDKKRKVYIISNYYDGIDYRKAYYVAIYQMNNKSYLIAKGNYKYDYDLHLVLDIKEKMPNIILKYEHDSFTGYQMFEFNEKKYNKVSNFGDIIEE